MIVAVGGTKGGIGKTTLALQLATSQARLGKRVWLIDGDRQGSAIASITNRAERPDLPAIAAGHYPDGKTLRAQVLAQQDLFDEIVIDVGGRDSTSLRAALMLADVLVVPFRPRNYDVWALSETSELIAEAQAQRDGLRALAVLNMADPGVLATDNREAADAVKDIPELELLDSPLRQRKALANASSAGLHVEELRATDPKAVHEIRSLVNAIYI
ncbi:AAA family ATPase [Xanthomonas hortorum pv. pelargonii]|uniref:AAA family ATPase n=1 Tax=Xanthomonas hortorum TaxID=56454 RepID=UPI0021C8AF64|nr:AAA family ATPase [Xanthomonas hortorum]MCU1706789.1 AAA family ATPase [Xanthomonas hortorum pv. pelargonii]MCU1715352.1 AAA family ATPase [Xanthomonas hortorum pv. pelargonii]